MTQSHFSLDSLELLLPLCLLPINLFDGYMVCLLFPCLKKIFIFICVCMCMLKCRCLEVRRWGQSPLELELQVVMEIDPRFSGRAASTLSLLGHLFSPPFLFLSSISLALAKRHNYMSPSLYYSDQAAYILLDKRK